MSLKFSMLFGIIHSLRHYFLTGRATRMDSIWFQLWQRHQRYVVIIYIVNRRRMASVREISCNSFRFFCLRFSRISCIFPVLLVLLYVHIMSCKLFRVNPHFIVDWMSRNSLLESGAISRRYLSNRITIWYEKTKQIVRQILHQEETLLLKNSSSVRQETYYRKLDFQIENSSILQYNSAQFCS